LLCGNTIGFYAGGSGLKKDMKTRTEQQELTEVSEQLKTFEQSQNQTFCLQEYSRPCSQESWRAKDGHAQCKRQALGSIHA